jgi:hypothetical protein
MVQDAHSAARTRGHYGHSWMGSRRTRTHRAKKLNRQKRLAAKIGIAIWAKGFDIIGTHRALAQAVPAIAALFRKPGVLGPRVLAFFPGLLLAAGATRFHGFFRTVPARASHAVEGARQQRDDQTENQKTTNHVSRISHDLSPVNRNLKPS